MPPGKGLQMLATHSNTSPLPPSTKLKPPTLELGAATEGWKDEPSIAALHSNVGGFSLVLRGACVGGVTVSSTWKDEPSITRKKEKGRETKKH